MTLDEFERRDSPYFAYSSHRIRLLCWQWRRQDAKAARSFSGHYKIIRCSAVKEPNHFEVRKSSSQVTGCTFFLKKLTFLVVALKNTGRQHRWLFHCQNCQNKTNKAVGYGNIVIFCSHYYGSRANLPARSLARAVDLPSRSFDLARPGVTSPLQLRHSGWRQTYNVRKILSPSSSLPLLAKTNERCSSVSLR